MKDLLTWPRHADGRPYPVREYMLSNGERVQQRLTVELRNALYAEQPWPGEIDELRAHVAKLDRDLSVALSRWDHYREEATRYRRWLEETSKVLREIANREYGEMLAVDPRNFTNLRDLRVRHSAIKDTADRLEAALIDGPPSGEDEAMLAMMRRAAAVIAETGMPPIWHGTMGPEARKLSEAERRKLYENAGQALEDAITNDLEEGRQAQRGRIYGTMTTHDQWKADNGW